MWLYGVCLSLLTYFTQYNASKVHPCCTKWQDFIPFCGWTIVIFIFNSCLRGACFSVEFPHPSGGYFCFFPLFPAGTLALRTRSGLVVTLAPQLGSPELQGLTAEVAHSPCLTRVWLFIFSSEMSFPHPRAKDKITFPRCFPGLAGLSWGQLFSMKAFCRFSEIPGAQDHLSCPCVGIESQPLGLRPRKQLPVLSHHQLLGMSRLDLKWFLCFLEAGCFHFFL